ncbi:MAG: ABC transporter permease subunit [Aeromicrobium sp.]|uniref:ABC transporter permease n=1 Tax=Aeromicrobium sp. TaxID=1871063 RepID=UPI0039E415B2
MTPTIPSVRSRLSAAIVAFVLGFGLANVAIFTIASPDRVLWVGVAGVLMATSAWGVLVADSSRRVSVWAVLGVEIFAVFTLIPMLWVVSLAMSDGGVPSALWPEAWHTGTISIVLDDEVLRGAAVRSLVAAVLAVVTALPPAVGVALLLVRSRWRGRHLVRRVALGGFLVPMIAWALGAGDLVLRLAESGPLADHAVLRVALAQLVVAVPLVTWITTSVLSAAPWSLAEAARVDGATAVSTATRVVFPAVGPALLVGLALAVVVVAQDFALATAVTGSQATTLPVALTERAADPGSSAVVAAAGLLWAAPVAVLALVAPRIITRLLGGSYR